MTAWHFTGPPGCDVDDLGFIRPWASHEQNERRKEYEEWYSKYFPTMVRRRRRWESANPRQNHELLQRFIRKGVPHAYRKDIWMRSCPARSDGYLPKSTVPDDVVKAIRLDLPRTFPDNLFMRQPVTQRTLGRALFAIAEHIPSVGYCQGLNFVAGIVLLVVNDETKAIDLLVYLVSQRKDYYGSDMIGLRRDMFVLMSLLRRHVPRVATILEKLDIGLEMLVGKWFVSWFVESLPMETVLRIWDCLIYEGDEWLFRIAISLFRSSMLSISACQSIDQIFSQIKLIETSKFGLYCHQLILKSAELDISRTDIDVLRDEARRRIPT